MSGIVSFIASRRSSLLLLAALLVVWLSVIACTGGSKPTSVAIKQKPTAADIKAGKYSGSRVERYYIPNDENPLAEVLVLTDKIDTKNTYNVYVRGLDNENPPTLKLTVKAVGGPKRVKKSSSSATNSSSTFQTDHVRVTLRAEGQTLQITASATQGKKKHQKTFKDVAKYKGDGKSNT